MEAPRLPGLRRSLLILVLAVFLPLIAATAGLVVYQWRQQRDRGLADLQEQARDLRYALDRELTLDIAVLNALAASRDLDRADWKTFHEVARRTAQVRPGSWVILVDRDGQSILNSALPLGTPLPNLKQLLARPASVEWHGRAIPLPTLEIFEGPLRTGRPAFSGLIFGPVSKRPAVATNVPVIRDARAAYVLGMAYSPDFYVDLLRMHVTGQKHIAAIVDGNGVLVARNRAPESSVGARAATPLDQGTRALPAEGMGETTTLEGDAAYFAYSRSRVNDWVVSVGIPESLLLGPAWRVAWVSGAVVLLLFAIASFFAWRLWGRIAIPLTMLAERAQVDQRAFEGVPSSGIREVEALKQAMMDAALAQQQRQRSEAEREQARRELQQAHESLLEADRRKDEFLAMLGHELRNPLGAIGNAAGVLARLREPDRLRGRMYEIVARQSRHLGRIVDDLLDVARVTNGRMAIRRERVRLDEVARQFAEDSKGRIESKGLTLEVDIAGEIPVVGDDVRLTQVLANVLDNAAKYTPPGGRVALDAWRQGDQAWLRVRDTGMGISPELMPRIFEAFTQNPQAIERSQGGLGLGLAIVRRIVELHGGSVEARSAGENRGTEILVRLPVAA